MGDSKRRKQQDPSYGKPSRPVLDIRPDQSQDVFHNLPSGTTADDYLNYLDQNWDLMACFAYESYLNEGKGVLMLDWDLSLDAHFSLLSPELRQLNQLDRVMVYRQLNCPIFYLGARNLLAEEFWREWLTPDIQRLIRNYDPKTMIVLFLCWGFKEGKKGHIMGRTLAIANHKSPAQLYIENGDRQQEFGFLAGSNQPPPAPPKSRIVRSLQVEVEHNLEFKKSLRTVFDAGSRNFGKGAVLAVPEPGGAIKALYLPAENLARALGADITSRPFQQAQAIIDHCDPKTQIAVIAIDEGVLTSENFKYYPLLFRIGRHT